MRRPGRAPVPVDGLTAFVSGAGSGIGRALALRLAAHGCPLALVDLDGDRLSKTAEGIDGPVLARTLDVRDAEAQAAFAAEVSAWAPAPLGMVCNNAGVTTSQPVAGAVVEDDDWVMDVNFRGAVCGVRAFLPLLLRQRSGVIVNISSAFGLVGFANQSAYCASKFALRGFTESLRIELRGSGVRAVTVHPGAIPTGIVRASRYHGHPLWPDVSREQAADEFDRLARTTPERAAQLIHEGVRAGRERILIGADARALDVLARVMPERYVDLLAAAGRLAARRR